MKKGQATIFVILGLVALITIFITLSVLQTQETDVVAREQLVSDDSRIDPVTLSMEACITEIGKEALRKLGETGGYLDIASESIVLSEFASYSNNAVKLFPESESYIPYWRGIASNPDCVECVAFTQRPPLEGDIPGSIQSQIQNYVQDNIVSCVDGFQNFEALNIEHGEPEVIVDFRNQDTRIETFIDLNITIIDSQSNFNINYFSSDLDIPFRNIYEIASSIMTQVVDNQGALEKLSKELLSIYGGAGTDGTIPPINGGTDIGFSSPNMWLLSDVKDIVQTTLQENINYLQIYGSESYQRIGDMEDQFMDRFINDFSYGIRADRDTLSNTKINFNYFDSFPTYLQILPSRSELIMPEKLPGSRIPFLPITAYDYNFQYDLTYPVVISLENSNAYDGEGYNFNFAVESNIRNNELYNVEFEEDQTRIEGISLTDPAMRNNLLEVHVKGFAGQPVEGAVIKINCLGQDMALGQSVIENGQSIIQTLAPSCTNAHLYADGPEYFSTTKNISIDANAENKFTLDVFEEYPITINPRKKNLLFDDNEENKQIENYRFQAGSDVLSSNEDLDVIFTRLSVDGSESEYIRAFSTNASNQNLNLAPGNYNILITGTKKLNQNFTTQPEIIRPDVPWFVGIFGDRPDPVTVNATDLGKELFLGMLSMEDEHAIRLSVEDLEQGTMTIYLPAINYNDIIVTRHLQAMSRVTLVNTQDVEEFKPKIE